MGISAEIRARQHAEVDYFSGLMRERIRDEEERGDWLRDDPVFFIPALLKNLATLAEFAARDPDSLTEDEERRIKRDGADCANYALIITSLVLGGLIHA